MAMTNLAFPVTLLVLWVCGAGNQALETYSTHAHLEETPTHAHTLGRWSGVAARNLSCGDLTNVLRQSSYIVDLIDEFKNDYTQAAMGGATWDIANNWPIAADYESIQVCRAGNQDCFPVLAQLPEREPIHTEEEVKEMMVKMMGYIQRYMVASESLVLDQSLFKDELGFLDEMDDLNTQLEDLNEFFLIPMTSCDLTPDPSLVRNLTLRMHQMVDSDTKDIRGFQGLRQIRLGLCFLTDVFAEPQQTQ